MANKCKYNLCKILRLGVYWRKYERTYTKV